jgi:hypothetical protein
MVLCSIKPKENKMAFIKHVGKHGDRNIALLFRQVPGEDHMCLLIYPEVLPAHWHDTIMKVLESDMGQQAEEFAEALSRSLLPDGRVILNTLHTEKMIKKVRTADVIMTPNTAAKIRLDELNKMLNEMKLGDEAIKKMAQNDAARGMVDAPTKRAAEAEFKAGRKANTPVVQAPLDAALSDRDIATNMLDQAKRMEIEAKSMIAEAARMKKDAERLQPNVAHNKDNPSKTASTTASTKRGRPAKSKAVADAAE